MEHYIDHDWNTIAAKARQLIPDDPEEDKLLNERYHDLQESPRGCSITASGELWRCKMYLGGKQRVLGYGTASQMARLYDAALWRFRQYRTDKPFAIVYNYSEQRAGDDNLDANIQIVVCDFERLLLERKLIYPPDEREALRVLAKQDSRHKYTKSGRMEELLLVVSSGMDELAKQNAQLIERVSALEGHIDELAKRLTVNPEWITPPPHFTPHDYVAPAPMHIIPGVINPGPGYIAPQVTCKSAPFADIVCKHPDSVQ